MCYSVFYRRQAAGFTLLEMSIVLVIIAFLVGGIVAGKALVAQSQLRTIIEELQTYQHAVELFHEKYNELPGDMIDAEQLWGTAAAGNACLMFISTGPETCNGNGDGMIDYTSHSAERNRAWQHMSNAGMVSGQYTGVDPAGINGYTGVAGVNEPASALKPGGYTLGFTRPILTDAISPGYFIGTYGNNIHLGFDNVGLTQSALLKPSDQQAIDLKMDDGHPTTGIVLAHKSPWNLGCTTTDVSTTAEYNVTGAYKDRPACDVTLLTNY